MTRLQGTFRSLHVRNYRLFFWGQSVSLIGTWMQATAVSWLVLQITNSPTQVGLVIAAQFVPALLGSIYGGLVADRFDKRKILIGTQTALLLQAATLAAFALAGRATLPVLYILVIVQGAITTLDNPTRQAFVSELVSTEEVTNAIGLNSAMFNAARIVGPAVAGILIKTVGVPTCFVINAASFVAVLGGLFAIRPAELHAARRVERAKGQLREGLLYAWREPTLRMVLLMIAVVGTLAMNFMVILPVLAKNVFNGDAGTFGFFTTVIGVGAFGGAVVAATRTQPTVRLLAVASTAFGVSMLLDAVAPSLVMEVFTLAATGAASITLMASANATVQLTSRPEMRGRVMSIYMLLFLGSTPIGGPIIGWIGEEWSARWSLATGGVACLAAALLTLPLLLRQHRERRAPGIGLEAAAA